MVQVVYPSTTCMTPGYCLDQCWLVVNYALYLSKNLMYSWVKISFDSSCLTSQVKTIGPCSVPGEHVYETGIPPEPMMTYCPLPRLYQSNKLTDHGWRPPLTYCVWHLYWTPVVHGPCSVPVDHVVMPGCCLNQCFLFMFLSKKYVDLIDMLYT